MYWGGGGGGGGDGGGGGLGGGEQHRPGTATPFAPALLQLYTYFTVEPKASVMVEPHGMPGLVVNPPGAVMLTFSTLMPLLA